MTDTLKITLAQLGQSVGDVATNAAAMRAARDAAQDADLVVFPELQLVGYPPEDLVLRPDLVSRAEQALEALARQTTDDGPAMLVGSVFAQGGALYNGVALLDEGRIVAVRFKHKLPNQGTFDEKRLFEAGPLPEPVNFRGILLGVPVCEDIWHADVCRHLADQGAQILICPNASPYEMAKDALRLDGVARARVRETGLPLVYVNRVGGQDEVVFDGASFALNADGSLAARLCDWSAAQVTTRWMKSGGTWHCGAGVVTEQASQLEGIYSAMVTGLRDYVDKNGFPGVVLGMSGGIDSAICAAIAVDALGAKRVQAVMLPSRFTSRESLDDAAACCKFLGCSYDSIPIEPAVAGFDAMLADKFAETERGLAEENLQSRIRGVTLMALSNKFGAMLMTTGNKSELSVGYATIYGDMAGGYNPIKDAYKTTVFALSRWRNDHKPRIGLGPDGPVMAENVITKPPTAELRADQKDSDSLPPYDVLDPILEGLVERQKSVNDLVNEGFDRTTVTRIERLLYLAEYKRRQAPPGVKLGSHSFGRCRRYPITHTYRSA